MERERDEAMRIAALRAEDGYLVEEKQGLAKIQRLFREHNSERIRQTVNSLRPTPLRVWSGMDVSADGPVWLAVVVMPQELDGAVMRLRQRVDEQTQECVRRLQWSLRDLTAIGCVACAQDTGARGPTSRVRATNEAVHAPPQTNGFETGQEKGGEPQFVRAHTCPAEGAGAALHSYS